MVAIQNCSSDISWAVLRKNSAFLHKRRGVPKFFSSDKFNLKKLHTSHSSGISSDAGVSIRVADDKKGLIVQTKNKGSGVAHTPAKSITTAKLSGTAPRKLIKSVEKLVQAYQPSLKADARRRTSQLLRSINPRKKAGKGRGNKLFFFGIFPSLL